MNEPLLVARGIERTFTVGPESLTVLRGIDLDLAAGEVVAITGPSGSGKSTLLHILGTLDRPSAGTLRLAGTELSTLPDVELAAVRNRAIGFVFQFHHLLPEFTVLENVALPLLIARRPSVEAFAASQRMLEPLGLAARAAHRPDELSGGEKQRAALGRALIAEPALVLADEPTGNLDAATAGQLLALIGELNRRLGTAFLIVTHNEKIAASANRRFHLENGRLS